ncbi:ANTH domain-containing protein [Neohortaea acidophila]|uniref:ANTH domain-containing protein n=1 Tax=Neohortaea acidophila TaxID=245834 RepID=A0A6A6PVV9_9PEZI|nr:ANTH domain-containing protein [Neohortaea acidophila]KAF2483906.1 ANTH domain-containing protein [Neohortaea acidophila]
MLVATLMPYYYPPTPSAGMSNSFEKSVKGGTKVKLAPPKSKYVEHILLATQSGEAGVGEVFRTLTHRLHDSTWTVAFKSLIIVHLMIKEGAPDVTLSYLSTNSRAILAVNQITDAQTQGQNIRRYSDYLRTRAQAFGHAKCDYVRSGETRMKKLIVDKGLLRETEVVQEQVKALVKCDFLNSDVENEISLTAFRLLTRDLMDLYNAENEAMMNVLSQYFELSRPDAERAVKIYKRFCSQTEEVVAFLGVARQYEYATRLQIPKIKHAPTGLAKSLQDYLDDKDFEVNRRQYLAEQEAKRTGRPVKSSTPIQRSEPAKPVAAGSAQPRSVQVAAAPVQPSPPPKGPAPDLIDFFESIEQNQQVLGQSVPQYQLQHTGFPVQQQQNTGFPVQQQQQSYDYQQNGQFANNYPQNNTNPFLQQTQQQPQQPPQVQTQFTNAGFGGYAQQPQQQQFMPGNAFSTEPQSFAPASTQSPVYYQSPQQTGAPASNPFRQSTMPTADAPAAFNAIGGSQPVRQSTNPFARNAGSTPTSGNPFAPPQQPMQAQATGTNPFARNAAPLQQNSISSASPLQAQQTGTTNPFRNAPFVNQQTGQGWQYAPQATLGGFEQLETIPVFPRPA